MQASALEGRLRDALVPRIEALGYECVDLSFVSEGGRRVLRILVDAPAGVTADACAQVSRGLGAELEALAADLPERYVLEVSSPGINRPLVRPEHFQRFLGETVKIRLKDKLDGGQTLTGVMRALDGDVLTVVTSVGEKQVPLGAIARARLHRDVDAILRASRQHGAAGQAARDAAADTAGDAPAAD
jgi:ribosome maturation factor RimP